MAFYYWVAKVLLRHPVRAIKALYWQLTGRKLRARNCLRLVVAQSPVAYDVWIRRVEGGAVPAAPSVGDLKQWACRPCFTLLCLGTRDAAAAFHRSLEDQAYPHWRLPADVHPQPASVGERLRHAIASASTDYIVPLRPGAALAQGALFALARAAAEPAQPHVLYGDNDEVDARGHRTLPWLKPRWNAELFLAQDYLSQACAIRTDAAREALQGLVLEPGAEVYSLLLAISRRADARIEHVPGILVHLSGPEANLPARVRAAACHLLPHGAIATEGPFDTVRVQWPLPEPEPLVSIIVPTRDKMHLLRECLSGVLSRTRYRNFEILVVDNGSTERETLRYLSLLEGRPGVRVLRYDRPYNYSAINNFAVHEARGDYLCLLNNDTSVLDENWLGELMRYAVKDETGAVGAQLLYDDGCIQHAGVVIGIGDAAGHAHRFQKPGAAGYFARAHAPHYTSAVTAACLVVAREKYLAVGGLDEEAFAIAFNDVDLCLKLQQAGWRNVYAPQAVLVHHESRSRGSDVSPANIERYRRELRNLRERWNTRGYADPLHHPLLDRGAETYILAI